MYRNKDKFFWFHTKFQKYHQKLADLQYRSYKKRAFYAILEGLFKAGMYWYT